VPYAGRREADTASKQMTNRGEQCKLMLANPAQQGLGKRLSKEKLQNKLRYKGNYKVAYALSTSAGRAGISSKMWLRHLRVGLDGRPLRRGEGACVLAPRANISQVGVCLPVLSVVFQ